MTFGLFVKLDHTVPTNVAADATNVVMTSDTVIPMPQREQVSLCFCLMLCCTNSVYNWLNQLLFCELSTSFCNTHKIPLISSNFIYYFSLVRGAT